MASVIRFAKFRPFTGRLCTSSGVTLTPILAPWTSSTFASADTFTVSLTLAMASAALAGLVSPTPSVTAASDVAKPSSVKVTLYEPGPRLVTVKAPPSSVTAVRTAPVWAAVTVTVTPGRTAELASVTLPTMRDSVNWAAAGRTAASSARPARMTVARERNADIQRPPRTQGPSPENRDFPTVWRACYGGMASLLRAR